ncbi:hypothetical protein BC835DRAFT_524593 [Cytidiella melzeri]|nr:hypothetical protein BC835DRAFT_524593 [Cytidiella melzeri]
MLPDGRLSSAARDIIDAGHQLGTTAPSHIRMSTNPPTLGASSRKVTTTAPPPLYTESHLVEGCTECYLTAFSCAYTCSTSDHESGNLSRAVPDILLPFWTPRISHLAEQPALDSSRGPNHGTRCFQPHHVLRPVPTEPSHTATFLFKLPAPFHHSRGPFPAPGSKTYYSQHHSQNTLLVVHHLHPHAAPGTTARLESPQLSCTRRTELPIMVFRIRTRTRTLGKLSLSPPVGLVVGRICIPFGSI